MNTRGESVTVILSEMDCLDMTLLPSSAAHDRPNVIDDYIDSSGNGHQLAVMPAQQPNKAVPPSPAGRDGGLPHCLASLTDIVLLQD
jgi:hypothetical protein